MTLSKDQQIEFITDHGQKLKGFVVDFNDVAIQVSNDIGTYIISYQQLVSQPQIGYKQGNYDFVDDPYLGWWD